MKTLIAAALLGFVGYLSIALAEERLSHQMDQMGIDHVRLWKAF